MIAADEIDLRLIRWANLTGAAVVGNYVMWAIHAPSVLAMACVIAGYAATAMFLVKGPLARDLPLKIFIVACVLLTLGNPTVGWDTRSIWMFHAKRMFFDSNLYAQFDNYAPWSSNDYPGVVPALSASIAHVLGHWSETVLKVSGVLAMFPALAVIASGLRDSVKQLMFLVVFLFVCDEQVFNGYMDALIALYFCAVAVLVSALAGGTNRDGTLNVALGLCITILTLTKNEGLVALAAIAMAALLYAGIAGRVKVNGRTVTAVALGLVLIAAWKIGVVRFDVHSEIASPGFFVRILARAADARSWAQILAALVLHMEFLAPFALAALAAIKVWRDRFFRLQVTAAGLYFCVLILVYLSTPRDLAWHLGSSADRTIFPVALMLGFAAMRAYVSAPYPAQPRPAAASLTG